MVSKNNISLKERQSSQQVPHFALRKLSVGLASVMLGTVFYFGTSGNVYADTVTSQPAVASETAETVPTVPQQTTSVDHAQPASVSITQDYLSGLSKVSDTASSEELEAKDPTRSNFYNNNYQSDPIAANEAVDPANMTGDQLLRLNMYSSRLVNSIRHQFNRPDYKLNSGMIEEAQRQATAEGQQKLFGHQSQFLHGAGENVGGGPAITVHDNGDVTPYGQLKASDFHFKKTETNGRMDYMPAVQVKTMDDMRAMVWYNVMSMMFADAGQEADGHAQNFAINNEDPSCQMALGVEYFNDGDHSQVLLRWLFPNASYAIDPKKNIDLSQPDNEHVTQNGQVTRKIYTKLADGTTTLKDTQTINISRTGLKNKANGQVVYPKFTVNLPEYAAPAALTGQKCVNPGAAKAVTMQTNDTIVNLPDVTFEYVPVDLSDSTTFAGVVSYNKPDGTTVGKSRIEVEMRRQGTKDANGIVTYGDWNTNDAKITVTGVPLKADNVSKVKSSVKGTLQFNQLLHLNVDEINKLGPGYHIDPGFANFFMMYWITDQNHTAFNGKGNDYPIPLTLIANDQQAHIRYELADGTEVSSSPITGKTDQTVKIDYQLPANFTLIDGQNLPVNYTFAAKDNFDIIIKVKADVPNKCTDDITYIDDKYGTPLKNDKFSNDLGKPIDYDPTNNIKEYIDSGYALVSNDFKIGQEIYTVNPHHFTVHLKHTYKPVVDPNPKTVSRTIHYEGAGDRTPMDNVQRVTLTRDLTWDNVECHFEPRGMYDTDWRVSSSDNENYKAAHIPVVEGYVAHLSSVTETDAIMTKNGDITAGKVTKYDQAIVVQYVPVGHIVPVTANHQTIPDAPCPAYLNNPINAAKVVSNMPTIEIPGYATSENIVTIDNPTADTQVVYRKLTQSSGNLNFVDLATGKTFTSSFDGQTGVIRSFDLQAIFDKLVGTDSNYELVAGQPTALTHELTNGNNDITVLIKSKQQLLSQVQRFTRTINVHQPDGTVKTIKQTSSVNKQLMAETALTTGTAQPTFEMYVPEHVDGYVADVVPSKQANSNETIDVYYHKLAVPVAPKYVDNAGKGYANIPVGYHEAKGQKNGKSLLILKDVKTVEPKTELVTRTIMIELPNGKNRIIRQRVMKGKKFGNVRLPKLRGYKMTISGGSVENGVVADGNVNVRVEFVKE